MNEVPAKRKTIVSIEDYLLAPVRRLALARVIWAMQKRTERKIEKEFVI